jgi:predicted  nucleic acid-binding Zn-ribbon protein
MKIKSELLADDDLLGGPPAPPAPPAPVKGSVTCGFCQASLTPGGEVMKLSDRAKSLRDFEDDLEDAKRTISELQAKISTLEGDVTTRDNRIGALEKQLKEAKKFW